MFKEKVGKSCYPGRSFSSCIQFNQSNKLLCSQWNISTLTLWNCIQCCYRERKQKSTLHPNPAKRCKQHVLCYDCPCIIVDCSLPGLVQNKNNKSWKPGILYKVKIIFANVFAYISNYRHNSIIAIQNLLVSSR